jgi:hypothetical protein
MRYRLSERARESERRVEALLKDECYGDLDAVNDTTTARRRRERRLRRSLSSVARVVGVINAGSSSLKVAFYDGERRIISGQVDGLGIQPAAKASG